MEMFVYSNICKVLVAGCQGYIGNSLINYLESIGVNVVGVDISCNVGVKGRINADITDCEKNIRLIRMIKPNVIYHLVGLVGSSDPTKLFNAHVTTTKALLEAVSIASPKCKTVVVGSAAEYGERGMDSSPITEYESPLPITEYGRSKVEQSIVAAHLAERLGIDVVRVRLFNTLGEGQSSVLVGGSMVRRLYETMINAGNEFEVYDASSVRDYLDVRDIVRLLWDIGCNFSPHSEPIPINVGSGQAVSVEELASLLLKVSGLGSCIRIKPVRGAGSPTRIVANIDRLKKIIPDKLIQSIPFSDSVQNMWGYHLGKRKEKTSGS